MTAMEVGKKLVALCSEGKTMEALDTLYSDRIVSIEAMAMGDIPARMEGIEAIRGKNQWWYDNHQIHAASALGPFCGHRADQFAVYFDYDITNTTSGERNRLREVALYTVKNGKIVQEEFLYLMA